MNGPGAPPQDFAADLEDALVVFEGWMNNGANLTAFSSPNLSGLPNYEGNQVIIDSPWGGHGQARQIVGSTVNGTVVMDSPLSGTPGAGATFKIMGIRITPYNISQLDSKVGSLAANQTFQISYLATIQSNTTILYWQNGTIIDKTVSLGNNDTAIYNQNVTITDNTSWFWYSNSVNLTAIYTKLGSGVATTANQTYIIYQNITSDVNASAYWSSIITNQSAIYSGSNVSVRRIQSGSKTIGAGAGAAKYLEMDSGVYGAEVTGVVIKGVVGYDWTLNIYVPAEDGVAAPAAEDLRSTETYTSAGTEGGLIDNFPIMYNAFFDFTNNTASGNNTIYQVAVQYYASNPLTLTWET